MKPLRIVPHNVPPTSEDIGVIHFRLFHGHGTSLMRDADRRDAELMWSAQQARYRTFPVDMPPLSMISVNGEIACGGAMWDANPVWRHRHST